MMASKINKTSGKVMLVISLLVDTLDEEELT
jgi:hypothetical protein